MIAYVLPTRDRPERLAHTLAALGSLPPHDAQVIVVDNASRTPPKIPVTLPNGLHAEAVYLVDHRGAAARNYGVAAADRSVEWIVMLDDDSHPVDLGHIAALESAPSDVAAVGAEIFLPEQGKRESGGLPEVIIGCGAAIRRREFLEAGGYDPAFDYYAEEYDLSAKLMLRGGRLTLDRRFRVNHHKVAQGRSMDRILRRLVRNNSWVMQRYAPKGERGARIWETIRRYARIAHLERAEMGYAAGLAETLVTLLRQRRTPMSREMFDRFTGLAHARASLRHASETLGVRSIAIVSPGKNESMVRQAARELNLSVVDDPFVADARVIGTLSPGPMLDAYESLAGHDGPPVIAPWDELTRQPSPASSASVVHARRGKPAAA